MIRGSDCEHIFNSLCISPRLLGNGKKSEESFSLSQWEGAGVKGLCTYSVGWHARMQSGMVLPFLFNEI